MKYSSDVLNYATSHDFNKLLKCNLSEEKNEQSIYTAVDQNNITPFAPDLDDLVRLHKAICDRRVTTIMEFGVGYSTIIMADALRRNKQKYGNYVTNNLRRSDAFKIFSIDANREFIALIENKISSDLCDFIYMHFSECRMMSFNGRITHCYDSLPNICPDFIYLDAPGQYDVQGDIYGIHTRSKDRLPMSADLLIIEHFLLPGTSVLVDGRTASARFLKANFQRFWLYNHDTENDIHTFELLEKPLGKYNKKQLEFCLGESYFRRLNKAG